MNKHIVKHIVAHFPEGASIFGVLTPSQSGLKTQTYRARSQDHESSSVNNAFIFVQHFNLYLSNAHHPGHAQ